LETMGFVVLANGGYLVELRVQPKEPVKYVPTLLVRISNDGQSFKLITTKRTQAELGYLEGLTDTGKFIFLKGSGPSEKLVVADQLPRN
jgi:hypothetical protein